MTMVNSDLKGLTLTARNLITMETDFLPVHVLHMWVFYILSTFMVMVAIVRFT